MIYLFEGFPDSGKSKLAENLVCEVSNEADRFYLATMIPFGEEGKVRIEKHKRLRAGKGFTTIEMPFDIDKAIAFIENPSTACVLVECISNMVANEMFERKTHKEDIPNVILSQIKSLSESVNNLVIVTNRFDFSSPEYDEETIEYIEVMEKTNDLLKQIADEIKVILNEHI